MTYMLAVIFGIFVFFLILGMPVGYGMAIATGIALIIDPNLPGLIISQKMFTALDSFSMMAIPFFMLAGALMEHSGITRILVNWARSLVGHLYGGLGHATIVTGVVMAGVSGSANADTSALASILVPVMREEKYEEGYACALVASCGALGPIIPPSITMVIYSGVTSISISALFMAGFLPGIIIAAGFMVINAIYARRHQVVKTKFVGVKALLRDTYKAVPALVMPVIIIGGIITGIVTATEAGVLACTYSLLYGLFFKTLPVKTLKSCLLDAVHGTTNVMIIIGFACVFGALATNYNLSAVVIGFVGGLTNSGVLVLILITLILVLAGMFIDPNAAMLMLIPVFIPLVGQYGFDNLHFAMVCVLTLVMGGLTPPVGMLMYIASSITETPLTKVVKNIFPFLVVIYIVVIAMIFIPEIAILVPRLAGYTW